MSGKREISEPLGPQSPEVNKWKDTLRFPQKDVPSSSLKRTGSSSVLRRSTGNLAASFSMSGKTGNRASVDLANIEAEYIKNLQQQVYFLELEANYLREQARKATDAHPVMTAEAERMLTKLRQMQADMDSLRLEIQRKESNVDMLSTEKERALGRLKAEEESHAREKRLLLEEVVQLKKEKDLHGRDSDRKDAQLQQAREELDKNAAALRNSEHKIQILKNQLDQKTEQHQLAQQSLEEKRTELLQTETKLREIEDKYYSSTATLQDKLIQDLRDEICMLRQKLKETEMNADQDRFLRNKMSEDSSHLVKENALLNQQVLELGKQLERERALRESNDTRRSQSITELVHAKDKEKQMKFDLDQVKEQLQREQERCKHYMEQLSKQEQISRTTELNSATTHSRLAELDQLHMDTETENGQLRRDKMLLVDHVADLQKQLDEKEKEIIGLRGHIRSMESRLADLEHLKDLESTVHTQKWEEFSRLADSMKSLSRTMARTASPGPTPRSSRILEYS